MIILMAILACTVGQPAPGSQPPATLPPPTAAVVVALSPAVVEDEPTIVPFTLTPPIAHGMLPAVLAVAGRTVYDVESEGTAPEKRAPYGDSYGINRLERPFQQDMTYVPNLDLSTYMVGMDSDWVYVSITLVGNEPNDPLGIDYAVELDKDHDGFGDFIIWAKPPYPVNWDTAPVKIYQDTNHDTGGLSGEKTDAVFDGNGYDKLVFNGGPGDSDPDMAWVRVNNSFQGSVQFAFKRSWSGNIFMLGVMADAGWKDPGKLDYVDRLKLTDAGSPIRDSKYYPLKGLYLVDNVCREAFGFKATGYEPQLCPMDEPAPQRTPKPHVTPPPNVCQNTCPYEQYPYPDCRCYEIIK
jgi:hypothetical protein